MVKSISSKTYNKGIGTAGVVLIVVVIFGGLYLLGVNTHSVGTQLGATTTVSSGICPTQTQNFQVSVGYMNFADVPAAYTLVSGQTINTYSQSPTQSSTPSTASATSSSSAPVAVSGLNCNGTYLVTAGDNVNYFLNGTTANIGTNVNLPVKVVANKYSAPTITVQNATSSAASSTARFHDVTAGRTFQALLTIQAGQYSSSEGMMAVTLTYNSLAVKPSISGATPVSVAVPAPTFVTSNAANTQYSQIGSQNAQVTYLVPEVDNYAYASMSGASSSPTSISVTVQSLSAYATNEVIGVQITPATDFFNTVNGQLMTGQYVNPLTQANIFSPVVTSDAIQLSTN